MRTRRSSEEAATCLGRLSSHTSGSPFPTLPLSVTWLASGSSLSEREGWSGGGTKGIVKVCGGAQVPEVAEGKVRPDR